MKEKMTVSYARNYIETIDMCPVTDGFETAQEQYLRRRERKIECQAFLDAIDQFRPIVEALNMEPVVEAYAAGSYIYVKKEYWNEVQRIRKEAIRLWNEISGSEK